MPPKVCSMPGCDKSSEHLFQFPINDVDRCKKWVKAVNCQEITELFANKDLRELNRKRLCHHHFNQDDLITLGSRMTISRSAVPLGDPNAPNDIELVETIKQERKPRASGRGGRPSTASTAVEKPADDKQQIVAAEKVPISPSSYSPSISTNLRTYQRPKREIGDSSSTITDNTVGKITSAMVDVVEEPQPATNSTTKSIQGRSVSTRGKRSLEIESTIGVQDNGNTPANKKRAVSSGAETTPRTRGRPGRPPASASAAAASPAVSNPATSTPVATKLLKVIKSSDLKTLNATITTDGTTLSNEQIIQPANPTVVTLASSTTPKRSPVILLNKVSSSDATTPGATVVTTTTAGTAGTPLKIGQLKLPANLKLGDSNVKVVNIKVAPNQLVAAKKKDAPIKERICTLDTDQICMNVLDFFTSRAKTLEEALDMTNMATHVPTNVLRQIRASRAQAAAKLRQLPEYKTVLIK